MKIHVLTFAVLAAVAPSPSLVGQSSADSADRALFDAYPVTTPYSGHVGHLDLGNPEVRRFRTRLQGALEGGPNFAGHLAIVTWGCGTQCISYAILDIRTGRLVPDTSLHFSCADVHYRRDSRLVIERGDTVNYGPCSPTQDRLWVWQGSHLTRIAKDS